MSTTAEQARELGLKNYERSRRLPRWRWLAIRNAQNRSIFWNRAAFHLLSLEREMPKVEQCPICAAWETESERRRCIIQTGGEPDAPVLREP